MMSAKFSDFFDPLPPCPHLPLIYTSICSIKSMQPPLPCLLFHDPPPPLLQTSYLEAPFSLRINRNCALGHREENPPNIDGPSVCRSEGWISLGRLSVQWAENASRLHHGR